MCTFIIFWHLSITQHHRAILETANIYLHTIKTSGVDHLSIRHDCLLPHMHTMIHTIEFKNKISDTRCHHLRFELNILEKPLIPSILNRVQCYAHHL